MNDDTLFPAELARLGPLVFTDTLLSSVVLSVVIIALGYIGTRIASVREVYEVIYESLEKTITSMVQVDARPLVPLILTLWLFIVIANLSGLLPGVKSPTGDLAVTSSLAAIAFLSGHVLAFRAQGFGYLKHYLQPNPLLLPFNIIGEVSRTVALSLRLFGNMLSGQLISAILVYLVGLLLPVPLMLLSVLTSVVQAYIFGVLTLVFAASSMKVAQTPHRHRHEVPQT
jgi:F-type H+-transporting ATPase subunit a